jgi:hypothetical protein
VGFLAAVLAGWYTPAERDVVLAGLDGLDARARAAHGAAFPRLRPDARLALLTALDAEVEAARRAARPPAPAARGAGPAADAVGMHWFAAFRFLTIWGWATSRAAMEQALGAWPLPGRYDADAPVRPRRASARRAAAPHAHATPDAR